MGTGKRSEFWPGVTTILRPYFTAYYGELEFDPNVQFLELPCGCKKAKSNNQYTRRGTHVGEAMDVLATGKSLHPDWEAWFYRHDAWIPFLEAGKKYLQENPPAEIPVVQYHLEDNLQKCKGHADWIFPIAHKVVDVKTGASEPPEFLGMQTGAYAVMAHNHFGYIEQREILWLRPDGDYRIIRHTNKMDEFDFQDELRAYWVRRERLRGR